MSTQAMPQIPPRPSRTQEKNPAPSAGGNLLGADMPKIPPRPLNRRIERSPSPHRESFARSPFNEIPPNLEKKNKSSSIYSSGSENPSSSDLPHRPASVVLPSLGQEGSEYAEAFEVPDTLATSPTQTRSIANDLKLHAPKPSLPQSSAKQRVSTVTRTDSDQAAALGYGKTRGDRVNSSSHSVKSEASFTSQSSSHETERRPSSSHGQDDEAIPEIGLRVPMYRDAGDVQAPSPQPSANIYAPGIGFHNDGSQKPRHHGRRASGKGFDVPPGSYGLHGHGILHNDPFEKAYYEKHPELLHKECGQYGGAIGENRGEFVLSSEDLNKLVRETASRGSGLGTSSSTLGTPSEQVGFQASEEYTSRMSSPHPQSLYHNKAQSNASQTHIDSPLRNESIAAEANLAPASLGRSLHAPSDQTLGSETEDENTIHVDDPSHRLNKIYGGEGHLDSIEDLGPHNGHVEEDGVYVDGYSAPILASDEVAKEPFTSWEMQPAVSPRKERRGSHEHDSAVHHRSGSVSSLSSRPSSRPTSIHGGISGMRETHSTPLEDLNEYEPLFPESEKEKPLTAADRLKRPELKNRKFPSQDIWEDTPNSLQYTATVSTPQVPEEHEEGSVMKTLKIRDNETAAQAFARRQEELAESESSDSGSFLNAEKKPWSKPTGIPAHLAHEARPPMKQRFPSRDIWEDTPDSLQLQTTVNGPQTPDGDTRSPPEERPTTGAVAYHQEKSAAGFVLGEGEGRATTGIAATMRPSIPLRPTKPKSSEGSDDRDKSSVPPSVPERPAQKKNIIPPAFATKPSIPERSKPTIPARPSKLANESSGDGLTRVTSSGSAKSQGSDSSQNASLVASKPKPPVPSRPVGSKIAALQGGFMSDLNKRLQLGPMAPKKEESKSTEEEVVQEKAPLADARKGRARGPARRAPAKSPAPAVITTSVPEAVAEKLSALGFPVPMVQWSINPNDGSLTITSQFAESSEVETSKAAESPLPTLTTNTSGETLHSPQDAASEIEKGKSTTPPVNTHAAQSEDLGSNQEFKATPSPVKLSDDLPVVDNSESTMENESKDDMTTPTGTVNPSAEPEEEIPKPAEQDPKTTLNTSSEIKADEALDVEPTKSAGEVDVVQTGETTAKGE